MREQNFPLLSVSKMFAKYYWMFAKYFYFLFLHFSRMFPSPQVWIDSYFVDVMNQQGLLDVCKISQMFLVLPMCLQCLQKMFAWIRNLFLRGWVADFCVDILIIQLRKCLQKCSIISQMCKNVCKFVKVCKNVCEKKKNFVGGVKIIIIFIQQDSRKIYFCTILPPLACNRQQRKKIGAVLLSVYVQQSILIQYFVSSIICNLLVLTML